MKITADTITDEQIRELSPRKYQRPPSGMENASDPDFEPEDHKPWNAEECSMASLVQMAIGNSELRHVARARCAEILNARAVKP